MPLARLYLRWVPATAAIILLLGLSAGLVRILPWLLAPDVPVEVAAPFARALAAVALETALLVGLPIGAGLAAAVLVERGEARALFAVGAAPSRLVGESAPALVAWALALIALSLVLRGDDAPGRFAAQLVQRGQQSCASAERPKSALVPLVGVTWLCFPRRAPRVVGALPASGGRAWFSAAALRPNSDLTSFELDDLVVVSAKQPGMVPLRLRVGQARMSGLASWARPASLSARQRAAIVLLSALTLSVTVAWLVCRLAGPGRLAASAISGAAAVAALSALHRVDRLSAPTASYALVPAAGLAALIAATLLWNAARRLITHLSVARTP